MKPTRAPVIRSSTPSSMPMPARRIGHTATFFPEIRGTVVRSSGVSISTSSVASSFVASYVRRSVTSFTSWRNIWVGVCWSRRRPSLCCTSGWSTTVTRCVATVIGHPLAYDRVEGVWGNREVPPRDQRRGHVGETWFPPRERAGGSRRSRAHRLGRAHRVYEGADAGVVFQAGARLQAAARVHAPRSNRLDRRAHVVGPEPAGED